MEKITNINEENKNELTDKEIDTIAECLEENKSETAKKMEAIKNEDKPFPYAVQERHLMQGDANVVVDPNTGEFKINGPAKDKNETTVTDIINENHINISNNELKEKSSERMKDLGLTEEEALKFAELLVKYKNGEKVNIYSNLPKPLKAVVFQLSGGDMNPRNINTNAKIILDQFMNELQMDKEFVDLQEAIKKEMNVPGLADIYEEHQKNLMETDILEQADKLEKDGYFDRANVLRDISKAYTLAYSFDRLVSAIDNNEPAAKRLDKSIRKYDKFCSDFNYKYEHSKFMINDIKLVTTTLSRHINAKNTDIIKKFIVLFCRITMNMSPDKMDEHAFMYYTIKTILSLDFLDQDKKTYKEIIDNINKVISKLS